MATASLVILLTSALACLALGAAKGFTISKILTIVLRANVHFGRWLAGRECSPFYDPNEPERKP